MPEDGEVTKMPLIGITSLCPSSSYPRRPGGETHDGDGHGEPALDGAAGHRRVTGDVPAPVIVAAQPDRSAVASVEAQFWLTIVLRPPLEATQPARPATAAACLPSRDRPADTRRCAIRVDVLHSGTFGVLFDHFLETRTRRPAIPRCSGLWALPLHRPGVVECRAPLGWTP
jgi:hypothetical protein